MRKQILLLSKTCLVKDEKLIDKFDIIFGEYFNSIDKIEIDDVLKFLNIPKDWLDDCLKKTFPMKKLRK